MRILCLYNLPADPSAKDELDVFDQRDAVMIALHDLGHEAESYGTDLNLEKTIKKLDDYKPDLVFNLVEALGGKGRFIHFIPTVLEQMRIPFTGADAAGLFLTTNKIITKQKLMSAGISTPDWTTTELLKNKKPHFNPPYFIKPVCEDASVGLNETAVIYDPALLADELKDRSRQFGECFAEAYIPGREFNLSILPAESGIEVLPPAEIRFENYPQDKLKIVDYKAKWDTDSFEYKNTVRHFDFPAGDARLLSDLKKAAEACRKVFALKGYVRVDFRVDEKGMIWVLEINANPCISPDSGFVAAANQAGLTFMEMIDKIVSGVSNPFKGI
ncbi:MAG: hypothetical protein JXR46_08110 [Calditrichaceae bacterium]|nr:hypothetical protein [Calditrichaceae bacterium]MBN2708993.1 hypothetical protein [Calditrichaceae bacterium]RQV93336.1 MAG: D-alanine--D-alanine ligase [Calditrichota bacterium]